MKESFKKRDHCAQTCTLVFFKIKSLGLVSEIHAHQNFSPKSFLPNDCEASAGNDFFSSSSWDAHPSCNTESSSLMLEDFYSVR